MNLNTVLLTSLLVSLPVVAQDYPYQQPYAAPQPYEQQQQQQVQRFSPEQLDDLVAPVALYPDSLLSQVLVAATYPGELADANQWLAQNGGLQGQSRIDAAQQQNWDPSVQALVAFPDVVGRMTQDMRWTQDLGNAFLTQEADVMSAVQTMRQRAQQAGRLTSTPEQTVNYDVQGGERVIEIQPANPDVVYVPVYNPEYVWGAPAYGYYPSLYYPSYGFGFGRGIYISAFFGGWGGGRSVWGWGPRWHERTVVVNNGFFNRYRFSGYGGTRYAGGSAVWAHDYARRGESRSFAAGGYSGNRNSGTFGRTSSQYQQNSYGNGFGRGSQVQSAPRGFTSNSTGSYGGYSRGAQAPVQQRSVAPQYQQSNPQPRSFSGSYGSGYGRSTQTPQVQQSQPRSFTGNYGGNYGGNYARTPQQAPVQQFQPQRQQYSQPREQQYSQPQQRQQFSQPRQQEQHFSAPAQQGGSRNEGGHRR